MIIFLDVIITETDKNDLHIKYIFLHVQQFILLILIQNTKNKHYKKLQFKMSYKQNLL